MPNLNKVQLMGNLTRDPEVKYTAKGTAITSIALAINHAYKTNDGEMREDVTFVEVTFFGKQAETIGEYCKKGRPLYVEGRLKQDSWDDKETGQKRYKMTVIGSEFQFLGGKKEGDEESPRRPPQQQQSRKPPQTANKRPVDPDLDADGDDGDVPF